MNGKVVNLRRARKAKTRDDARRSADANAAKHGRRKDDAAIDAAETARVTRLHEGHRIEKDET